MKQPWPDNGLVTRAISCLEQTADRTEDKTNME